MNLPTWPQRDLDAWLPDQWKLRHAARLANLNQQNSTTPDNLPSPSSNILYLLVGSVLLEVHRRETGSVSMRIDGTFDAIVPIETCRSLPSGLPGKVLVTGHVQVSQPEVNPTRIRLDTSGGSGYLTACLLRSADAEPEFISSKP